MMNLQILNVRPLNDDVKKVNKDGKLYHFTRKQYLDETKYHLDDDNKKNAAIRISDITYGDNDNTKPKSTSIGFKPNIDFMYNDKNNSSSYNSNNILQKSNSNSTIKSNTITHNNKPKSLSSFKENNNSNNNVNSMQMFDDYMDEINKKKRGQWINHQNNNNDTNSNDNTTTKVAMNIIQSKYEKNLEVISSLHDEKVMMVKQMSELQRENNMLRKQAGIDDYDDQYYYDDYNNDDYYSTRGNNFNDNKYNNEYDNDNDNDNNDTTNDKKMTAMELALLLEPDNNYEHTQHTQQRPKSAPSVSRSDGGNSSAVCHKRLGMSKNLLAAQDKFIQRRRAADIADRKKQIYDDASDREYREKVRLASLVGKAPTGVFERQKAANDKFLSKQEKKDKIAKEKKEADYREKREKIEADEEYRNDPKNHFTWQEMVDIEEAKRKDRIERRKHELASFSRAPKCAITETKKEHSRETEKKYEFIAEDPDLVAIRLQRERAEWEEHLEKSKKKALKKLETERVNTIDPVTGVNKFTVGMESRQQEYLKRKIEKEEKIRIEKAKENEKQRREDEIRTLRLRESLAPSTKITKSVEILINETKKKLDDQDKRSDRAMELYKSSNRISSYVTEVQEALNLKSKDAAAAFVEQSRVAMIKNKQNIAKALKNRPTLIQRQEAKARQEMAADNALSKINGIIKDAMFSDKAEEKVKSNSSYKYDSKYDSDDDNDDKEYK